jgi:hypothetical protein
MGDEVYGSVAGGIGEAMEGQRGMARWDTTCGSYKALEYWLKEVWRQSGRLL